MIEKMKLFRIVICLSIVAIALNAYSLECPKPPEQVNKDWDVEVNASIAKIAILKGPELKTKTKNATYDLLGKLPDASKIYLEQMMFSAYCTALRDDKTIKESEKANLLKEYRKGILPVIRTTSKKTSENSKKTTQNQHLSPQIKSIPQTESTKPIKASIIYEKQQVERWRKEIQAFVTNGDSFNKNAYISSSTYTEMYPFLSNVTKDFINDRTIKVNQEGDHMSVDIVVLMALYDELDKFGTPR